MNSSRIVFPPKLTRPLRLSLRRNRRYQGDHVHGNAMEHGYVVVGTRKVPVQMPRLRTPIGIDRPSKKNHAKSIEAAQTAEIGHEIIEDLFREARDGQFDVFTRRLKAVIQNYTSAFLVDVSRSSAATVTDLRMDADSFTAARKRGTDYALSEWQDSENLQLQGAAIYAGVSDNTINARRQTLQIYALVAPNRSRGFRYPKWQFDVDPERLRVALLTFAECGQDNCWVLHNLMMTPTPILDGLRPCDYIADSRKDLARLVRFIHTQFPRDERGPG